MMVKVMVMANKGVFLFSSEGILFTSKSCSLAKNCHLEVSKEDYRQCSFLGVNFSDFKQWRVASYYCIHHRQNVNSAITWLSIELVNVAVVCGHLSTYLPPMWLLLFLYGQQAATQGSYLIACWLRSISFESITPLSYALWFNAIDLVFLAVWILMLFVFSNRKVN